jgi:hypothetical protein
MELPGEVVIMINEFSKPTTRPDWRTLHRMPYASFKKDCEIQHQKRWNRVRLDPHVRYMSIFGIWWLTYMYNYLPGSYYPREEYQLPDIYHPPQ